MESAWSAAGRSCLVHRPLGVQPPLLGNLGLDLMSYHAGFRAEKEDADPVSSAKPQPLLGTEGWQENLPGPREGGWWGLLVSVWAPEADAGMRVEDHLGVFRGDPRARAEPQKRGDQPSGRQLVPLRFPGCGTDGLKLVHSHAETAATPGLPLAG